MSANDWDDEYCPDPDDLDCCEHGIGFDEECEDCEDDPLGCLFPETCLMPGIHLESECYTAEMMEPCLSCNPAQPHHKEREEQGECR